MIEREPGFSSIPTIASARRRPTVSLGPSARPAIASATMGGRAMTSRKSPSFEPWKRTTSAASTPASLAIPRIVVRS